MREIFRTIYKVKWGDAPDVRRVLWALLLLKFNLRSAAFFFQSAHSLFLVDFRTMFSSNHSKQRKWFQEQCYRTRRSATSSDATGRLCEVQVSLPPVCLEMLANIL
jgi:hypothetical protein